MKQAANTGKSTLVILHHIRHTPMNCTSLGSIAELSWLDCVNLPMATMYSAQEFQIISVEVLRQLCYMGVLPGTRCTIKCTSSATNIICQVHLGHNARRENFQLHIELAHNNNSCYSNSYAVPILKSTAILPRTPFQIPRLILRGLGGCSMEQKI